MTLRLTPEMLAAGYDYLRQTPPFRSKKLPESDDLEFRVTRHKDRYGHYDDRDGKTPWKNIAVSEVHVKTAAIMLEVLAHEMVHVALHTAGAKDWGDHGGSFKRLAARVCAAHGFDPLTF